MKDIINKTEFGIQLMLILVAIGIAITVLFVKGFAFMYLYLLPIVGITQLAGGLRWLITYPSLRNADKSRVLKYWTLVLAYFIVSAFVYAAQHYIPFETYRWISGSWLMIVPWTIALYYLNLVYHITFKQPKKIFA